MVSLSLSSKQINLGQRPNSRLVWDIYWIGIVPWKIYIHVHHASSSKESCWSSLESLMWWGGCFWPPSLHTFHISLQGASVQHHNLCVCPDLYSFENSFSLIIKILSFGLYIAFDRLHSMLAHKLSLEVFRDFSFYFTWENIDVKGEVNCPRRGTSVRKIGLEHPKSGALNTIDIFSEADLISWLVNSFLHL